MKIMKKFPRDEKLVLNNNCDRTVPNDVFIMDNKDVTLEYLV